MVSTPIRFIVASAVFACALTEMAFPGDAAAQPLARADSFRTISGNFTGLASDIARARRVDARAFATVQSIVSQAGAASARARGRVAPTARQLSTLGPSALLPILDLLALHPPKDIAAPFAPTVRRALIEATGLLRDARALSVLGAILDDASEDADTVRATTEAIARIGTDEGERRILAALASSTGERTVAIVSAMGECRRRKIAEALAARLASAHDDEVTARAAAKALGRTGNAWAWATLADRHEESAIRTLAARALIQAFLRYTGEARDAASNALMVVDSPDTAELLADATTRASAEQARDLRALEARFANNPSRVR